MQAVIDSFNDKVKEIDIYVDMLRALEQPGVEFHFPNMPFQKRFLAPDSDWIKTLKATTFLLIYNLVESSVRDGIGVIYDNAKADNCTAEELHESIRKVWVKQAYKKIENSENIAPFREKGHELVDSVIAKAVAELDKKYLPISGNLDAKAIRDLCDKHGLSFSKLKTARRGDKLRLVKAKRNSLAHGDESFVECGRDYTVSDIEEIKKQSVIYVRVLLNNVKSYVKGKKYKVSA